MRSKEPTTQDPSCTYTRADFFFVPTQVRQLSLVELRKRVTAKRSKQWLGQTQAVRTAIKARILEIDRKSVVYGKSVWRV